MNAVATETPSRIRPSRPDAKLRCEGLRKVYGSVVALDTTDLDMPEGEFLTLLGPSGSGKTTLLMLIAGLLAADAGKIWIDDKLASDLPSYARDIGMVFQSYALFPHMTVFDNIAFPLEMRRWSSDKIKAAVEQTLELVRLPHVADRYPRELSGGQQQRIALARCFVYRPSIILMDEPLGALDKKLRDQMQFEIKQLQAELNATVLYVTHDQDEAMAMSDRICLMNHGGVEQIGSPHDLYFRPASRFAADFLGESNLLPGRVISASEQPEVEMLGLRFAARRAAADLAEGNPITVMLRPESIEIGPGTAPNGLPAVVERVTMLGGVVRSVLRLGDGTEITSRSLTRPDALVARPGEPVSIHWQPEAPVLISRETTRGA
ncbi:MAG: ABC transporter ATP-binding protein [Bosea sp. (in: a-proteobacteria)]|uniref:ABC transporter ATP-binding protein n=1 Tax=Bosea sp. (in: a-proteobacteria) TaxID=1871050 RepID=UPI003F7C02CA